MQAYLQCLNQQARTKVSINEMLQINNNQPKQCIAYLISAGMLSMTDELPANLKLRLLHTPPTTNTKCKYKHTNYPKRAGSTVYSATLKMAMASQLANQPTMHFKIWNCVITGFETCGLAPEQPRCRPASFLWARSQMLDDTCTTLSYDAMFWNLLL